MKKYFIKDKIKQGEISYNIGDEVVVARRKNNGHPRGLKDDVVYAVIKIENDDLFVIDVDTFRSVSSEYKSHKIVQLFNNAKKVNKTYMIPKYILRDIKINDILNKE